MAMAESRPEPLPKNEEPYDVSDEDPDDGAKKPEEKMTPAFYLTLGLIGVLVLLIIIFNIPGTKASAGMTMT